MSHNHGLTDTRRLKDRFDIQANEIISGNPRTLQITNPRRQYMCVDKGRKEVYYPHTKNNQATGWCIVNKSRFISKSNRTKVYTLSVPAVFCSCPGRSNSSTTSPTRTRCHTRGGPGRGIEICPGLGRRQHGHQPETLKR